MNISNSNYKNHKYIMLPKSIDCKFNGNQADYPIKQFTVYYLNYRS